MVNHLFRLIILIDYCRMISWYYIKWKKNLYHSTVDSSPRVSVIYFGDVHVNLILTQLYIFIIPMLQLSYYMEFIEMHGKLELSLNGISGKLDCTVVGSS